MGREVLLDGKQLDVMIDDNLEITYENSALQSVSDFKMSYTNTYTLPLTDKNRAIFDAIDNVNAETSFVRKFHSLYEYRDGIPVIEDARVRIKTTKPRDEQIDIEVIWGALKSLADEIGKGNINDLDSEVLVWPTSRFMASSDNKTVGWLFFYTIDGISADSSENANMKYHFPSCRADFILERIFRKVTTPFILSDSFKSEIEKLWIPCLTKNSTTPGATIPDKDIMQGSSQGSVYTANLFHSRFTELATSDFGSFRPIPFHSPYSFMYLNTGNTYSVGVSVNMTIPSAVTGDIVEFTFWVREAQLSYAWHIATHRITLVDGITSSITWDNTTKKLTGIFVGSEAFSINVEADIQPMILDVITLFHGDNSTSLAQGIGANNATINNIYTFWLTRDMSIGPGDNIDAVYNLPKISQIDFLKNILAITGSYVYFKDGAINFDLIDNVLNTSPLNIEKWITTLKSESIEYTYEDYAIINRYNYLSDDTVITNANGVIIIDDDTLEDEKEVVSLKFGASDNLLNVAKINLFTYTDTIEYTGSNIKPRILSISENSTHNRLEGIFDTSIGFASILENKYKLFRSILSDPKVIEIELYMQKGDLYLINTNKLYYFWGANWLLIDLTVSTDGSGTGRFIQLN